MDIVKIYPERSAGTFKPLNATNGGPWHRRHCSDQYLTNFADYKAARIPFARNHDSADCSIYGGPYSHDITQIFPCFDADPEDPASYDFACTDESILVCLEAGTETFFRLGQSIEHHVKKHGTLPPKDFAKWAVICEHIIRHYNEGWADGYRLNIRYWEIWNEADLDPDDSPNKRTWGGTKAQFFDLYEVASKHLKTCFPDAKIGGPAMACNEEWAEDFLREMRRRKAPLDFFSWHIYTAYPKEILGRTLRMRKMLDDNGFTDSESILNEFNYVRGWTEDFAYSIETIHSVKNAAFLMAAITDAQYSPVDMLMYYDTRPSAFNGVFDFYTYKPLKAYYVLCRYGQCYDLDHAVAVENTLPDIYVLAGVDKNGKRTAFVTYYSEDDDAGDRCLQLDFGKQGTFRKFVLDKDHDDADMGTTEDLTLTLSANSCILLKEE